MTIPSRATLKKHFANYFDRKGIDRERELTALHEALQRLSADVRRGGQRHWGERGSAADTVSSSIAGHGWLEVRVNNRVVATGVDVADIYEPTIWVYPAGTVKIEDYETVMTRYDTGETASQDW